MSMRMLPAGHAALLVECDGLAEVLALHDGLARSAPAGVVEFVPAAQTLLVGVDPAVLPLESAERWIRRTAAAPAAAALPFEAAPGSAAPTDPARTGAARTGAARTGAARTGAARTDAARTDAARPEMAPTRASAASLAATSATATGAAGADVIVTVPVEYGGDDLHETARLLGVSPEVLVAHHVNAVWRVAFIGFAPGFGYLVSDDWPFQVPRLESPRTRVPAGSVALAGAFAGAYPRESPGGWRLVGRTDAVLWDAASDDPALFAPARRVRFRAVRP